MQGEVRIIDSALIHRSAHDVFAYGATPANWPEWHPTATALEGDVDRPVEPGDDLLEYDRFGFLTGRIRWRVDDAMPAHGWQITGVVEGMPIASGSVVTISYSLERQGASTRVVRTMTYRPRTFRAGILDALYLRRHNVQQSRLALRQMKRLLES